MRRKIEYLLRNTAQHPEGCSHHAGLGAVRVVSVRRIENPALWQRYAEHPESISGPRRSTSTEFAGAERSRPINCVRQLRHHFGPFLAHVSRVSQPHLTSTRHSPHAVLSLVPTLHGFKMVLGASCCLVLGIRWMMDVVTNF